MQRTLLTTAQVSQQTGVPQETLRYWRHRGVGPKSFKLGPRKVVYDEAELEAWIEAQRAAADEPQGAA
jgi:predicted DNA-binding transcriptional regulator AlpA